MNYDFSERYYPAVLLLLEKNPNGRLELDRTERPYDAFHAIVEPLLRQIDYEVQPAEKRRNRDETRWHHGLRGALWNMREDLYPEDGRIRFLGKGVYQITAAGRDCLESFLYSVAAPLDWLELETEECEDGSVLFRYCHPMTGDELISFGGTYSGPHFAGMKLK
jgi:hypothetical protein